MKYFLLAACMICTNYAQAKIYKCKSNTGKTSYSSKPCLNTDLNFVKKSDNVITSGNNPIYQQSMRSKLFSKKLNAQRGGKRAWQKEQDDNELMY